MGYYTDPQGGTWRFDEPGDPGYDPRNNPVDNTPVDEQIVNAGSLRVEPPTPEPIKGTVVGTSPKTNEVLIKTDDDRRIWVKSDEDTVKRVTDVINENERIKQRNREIAEARESYKKGYDDTTNPYAYTGAKNAPASSVIALKKQSGDDKPNMVMSRAQFMNLPKEYQNIALSKGTDALESALFDAGYTVNGKKGPAKILAVSNTGQALFSDGSVKQLYAPNRGVLTPSKEKALSKEQAELKARFDEQYRLQNMPPNERVKTRLWNQLKKPDYTPIVKLPDGSYAEVKGGTAAGVGPSNIQNILKGIIAIGSVIVTAKTVSAVKDAADNYQAQTGKKADPSNLLAVDSRTGAAFTLDNKFGYRYIPDLPSVTIEAKEGFSWSNPSLKPEGFTNEKQKVMTEGIDNFKPDLIIINDLPQIKTDAEDSYMKASVNVADARNNISKVIGTQLSDKVLNDIYEVSNKVTSKEDQARIRTYEANLPQNTIRPLYSAATLAEVDRINQIISGSGSNVRTKPITVNEYDDLVRSLGEYELKRAILADARKSYIASLNPTPISGNLTNNALYILGAYKLITSIKNNTKLSNAEKEKLIQQVQADIKQAVKTSSRTRTQSKLSQSAAEQAATSSRVAAQSKSATAENTQTNTRTGELSRTAENTTAEMTDTGTGTMTAGKLGMPDMLINKDGKLLLKPGSLVWEQGKLEVDPEHKGPETLYKYGQPPKYRIKNTFIEPKGYKDRGNTPRQTIQTIGGPTKSRVEVNLGVVTAIAKPNTREITFVSNKNIQRQRKPKPRKLKPISNNAFRIVRPHRTKRGGGITRRSNR